MRLIDSFMPVIGYLVLLRNNVAQTQPGYDQVRANIQRLLSQSELLVKKGECDLQEYDLARFIVCAWIDESLLASEWKERNLWQREQLQRLYYNTTEAGVEVFDRLNLLGLHQRDVREVYYVCLSLGFRGRFINQGDEFLLDQLRSSNLKILSSTPGSLSSFNQPELFPEAFPAAGPEIRQENSRFSMLAVAALVGPVVLFGLLQLIYRFTLSSVASKLF